MMPLQVDNFAHALSLRGAPRRDAFKAAHKARLGPGYYASDADLLLVSRSPARIVAVLDCKAPGEPLSFAEVIAYNELLAHWPIYVVAVRDPETGPFTVLRYRGGNERPRPPLVHLELVRVCADWAALKAWEDELRRNG